MKEIEFGRINGKPLVWRIAEQNHKGFPQDTVTIVPVSTLKNITFAPANPLDKIHDRRLWGSNRYRDSDVRRLINSDDFLKSVFSPEELEAIAETEIKVKQPDVDGGGIDVIRDRLFLLSASEVGLEEDDTEGGMIELFKDAKNRIALDIDGKPDWWWLRTPYSASSRHVRRVNSDGTLSSLHNAYNGHFGLRPACNIKITYLVSKGGKGMRDNDNLIEGMMQGIPVKVSENERLIIVTPNMTAKQYAATKLKVPRSGDPDIDAMIRESRRADFAQEIMSGLLAGTYYALDKAVAESFSKRAFCVANVMLAEWEKVEPL